MSLNLLNSNGQRGVRLNLLSRPAQVNDTTFLSKYFVLSEFNPKFTAGRNSLSINGSAFLKSNSEILVECLDSAGANLFVEMAKTTQITSRTYAYKESTSFVLSINVYGDTANGVGKLILYGTLLNGENVKWISNITIDKTLTNVSKVRFYNRPTLEVRSVLVPVLSTDISNTLKVTNVFGGMCHGLAVTPSRDTIVPTVNRKNIDVDYRLITDSSSIDNNTSDFNTFNSQMIGSKVDLIINKIQSPYSSNELNPNPSSASFLIKDVYNNKTLQLIDPYFYVDSKNNDIVVNIVSSSFQVTYPYVSYNNATASYLTSNIDGVPTIIQQSFADISYENIKPFSGYVARHKVYRRSLLSNGDFETVADGPLFINELLRDSETQNKFYELLGQYYNPQHVSRYWFTSSNNISLTATPNIIINSALLTGPNYPQLSGGDYLMVKNDTVNVNRNAIYVPFDSAQFLATSGSAYDSNFMELKSRVRYLLDTSVIIQKSDMEKDARLEFYFTSSQTTVTQEPTFTPAYGVRLGTISASNDATTLNKDEIFFYTPQTDLFGTIVIVPYRCQAYLKNLSFRVYGDDGFSPDTFITRIPWTINVANESFEIKAELYDVNHSLVYSDLRVLQNFDPSGSSLVPFIPGGGIIQPGTKNAFISGSLIVSQSIDVQTGNIVVEIGNIFIPNIGARPDTNLMSQSRFMSVRGDAGFNGELSYNHIVNIAHDDQYVYVSTGSSTIDHSTVTNNPVLTRRSLTSIYGTNFGTKIYYDNSGKQIEVGS